MTAVPDFIRAAMEAQGKVDVDEVAKAAAVLELHQDEPAPVRKPLADKANARRTDPVTSHAAAESLTSTQLRKTQTAVQACFVKHGAMHDEALVAVYQATCLAEGWPQQSESGLRTRRSELVDAEMLRDTGRTVTLQSGRSSIVWNLNE